MGPASLGTLWVGALLLSSPPLQGRALVLGGRKSLETACGCKRASCIINSS